MALESRFMRAAVVGAAKVFAALAFVGATAVLARVLDKAQYGTFRQCWMIYLTVAPILSLGLGEALFYFVPKYEGSARRTIVRRTLNLSIVMGLIAGAALLVFSSAISNAFSNAQNIDVFMAFSLFLSMSIPMLLVDGIFLAINKTAWAFGFNILSRLVVFVGIAIPIWMLSMSLLTGVVLLGIVEFLVSVALYASALKVYPVGGSEGAAPKLWQQVKFSLPIAGAGIFGSLLFQMDKFVIGALSSPEEFAVYSNGAMENPLVAIVTSASSVIIAAELVALIDKGDTSGFIQLWARAIRKIAAIVIPMSVFLVVFAREAVIVLYSSRYEDSTAVFSVYMLLAPVRMVSFQILFMTLNRNDFYLKAHIAAFILGIPAIVVGYYLYGQFGAVIGYVLMSYSAAFVLIYKASMELGSTLVAMVPWRNIISYLVVTVPIAILLHLFFVSLLGMLPLLALVIGGSLFFLFGVVAMIFFKVIRPEEWPILSRIYGVG